MFIEIHTANAGKSYLYDKMARYGRSRSSKLIQIESAYAISYWSCTATTLICLCSKYRFPDTAIYWSKICVFFVVFLSCRVSFETVTVTRLQAAQNAAARLLTGTRPHIACSPAAAMASSPPTSSVQAGSASTQSAAWASPTVLDGRLSTRCRCRSPSTTVVGCRHMCSATDPYMPRRSCVRSRRTTSVERLPISLRQSDLSLGQFRRALKRICSIVSAGPSDFCF